MRNPVRECACHGANHVWGGRTPVRSQVLGGLGVAGTACPWLAEKGADSAAGRLRLCQWARGFPAGSLPPCSISTTWACDRDVGQGRVDSHLEIKAGSLGEAASGVGPRV